MDLVLVRVSQKGDLPKRGVLLLEGEPLCVTLELPWRDNLPNISCIPTGEYFLEERIDVLLHNGSEVHRTYEVLAVEGREGILFHCGNTAKDTKGCILVGSSFDTMEIGVVESRKAFGELLVRLNSQGRHKLKIVEVKI